MAILGNAYDFEENKRAIFPMNYETNDYSTIGAFFLARVVDWLLEIGR